MMLVARWFIRFQDFKDTTQWYLDRRKAELGYSRLQRRESYEPGAHSQGLLHRDRTAASGNHKGQHRYGKWGGVSQACQAPRRLTNLSNFSGSQAWGSPQLSGTRSQGYQGWYTVAQSATGKLLGCGPHQLIRKSPDEPLTSASKLNQDKIQKPKKPTLFYTGAAYQSQVSNMGRGRQNCVMCHGLQGKGLYISFGLNVKGDFL